MMKKGTDHHVPQVKNAPTPDRTKTAIQIAMSRMRGIVGALHQLLEPLSRDRRVIPLRRSKPVLLSPFGVQPDKAVVTLGDLDVHRDPSREIRTCFIIEDALP